MQVTAFGVISQNGETGTLLTGVNFQIGSPSASSRPSSQVDSALIYMLLAMLWLLYMDLTYLHFLIAVFQLCIVHAVQVSLTRPAVLRD